MLLAATTLTIGACVPAHDGAPSADDGQTDTSASSDGAVDGPPLEVAFDNREIFCDGLSHDVGPILGAEPGERILLSSAAPVELVGGNADEQGRYVMVWSCQPNEARLRWDITAVGHDSGRRADFTIVGAAEDPDTATQFSIEVGPEPFVCNDVRRSVGTIGGATPYEVISFSSPQASNIRGGQADDNGELNINWECGRNQAELTWTITAHGDESGKSGQFVVVGQAPSASTQPEPTVDLRENPYVCDGGTREFAVLSNFVPLETVDFSSEQASGLIDGRADGDGILPIRWQCDGDDIGKTWNLTAQGVSSGRTVTVTFTGGEPPPGTVPDLAIAYSENPFACDGGSRVFATVTNFSALELVDFTSTGAGPLRQGQAGQSGELPIRWQCGAGDIDTIWEITATGATSGRSITVEITGAAPRP